MRRATLAIARSRADRYPFGANRFLIYHTPMVGLSVALGRFFEALFWAILKVAGSLAGAIGGGLLVVLAGWMALRWAWRRRSAGGGSR